MTSNEWVKSSYSNIDGCVEVRRSLSGDGVQVRDSKNPDAGTITFTAKEWSAFIKRVKNDEFIPPPSPGLT